MTAKLIIAGLSLFVACKGKEKVVQPVETVPVATERPDWVRSRPVSSTYYVGIGLGTKSRADYQEGAKKNAMNDLASEISVRVEGNSLLSTLDRRTAFSETYTSNIRTSTSEQLEGFELVDTWENGTEYWTYYRLSRAEHARIKAERKRKAIEQATDLYRRSAESLNAGDLKSAVDMDLRALLAMKEYWGESDQVDLDGRTVVLANELYSDLQRLVGGVRIGILPERCSLDHTGHFRREMLISTTFEGEAGRSDLRQLPLIIEYPGMSGKVIEKRSTDNDGQARTLVQRVQLDASSPEVKVMLDMDAMTPSDLEQGLVKPLMAGLSVPERRAAIDVEMPRLHMVAKESNMGEAITEGGAALALKEELSRKGFRFVDGPSEADMIMTVNASTREGGTANGFFTAYLDISFSFRDRKKNEVIYEGGRQGVKGVQLNYTKAGLEAYKKASQEVRKELVPAMMDAIL